MSCVIASAFTFITVIISCQRPCKIAGIVSPIDALHYNETDIREGYKVKKTTRVTPLSVARNNMSRSRKKVVVVVLSLSLSIVLTNTLFTLLRGFDMDKYISNQIVGDFVITHDQASTYDEDAFFKITPEQIEYLNQMEGVSEISPVYFSWGSSTTLLVLSVMPTLMFWANRRVSNAMIRKAVAVFVIAFSTFMVIGRLISGVHWATDIIGSVYSSAGLYMLYRSAVLYTQWIFN